MKTDGSPPVMNLVAQRRRCACVYVILPFCLLQASTGQARWTELAPMPTPRHDHKLLVHDGLCYAVSGAGDETVGALERYDAETGNWDVMAPIPDARGWFAAGLIDGKIYAAGGKRIRSDAEKEMSGDATQFAYLDSLNIYSIADDTWSTGAPLSAPRAGLKGAVVDGRFYAIAGNGVNLIEVYDPVSDRWDDHPPLPDGERAAPAVAVVGTSIYVIGGFTHGRGLRDTVLILNTQTGIWSRGRPMPTPRRDHSAVVYNGLIYTFGGVEDVGITDRVEIYDPVSDRWVVGSSMPAVAAWMGAASHAHGIILAGGARRDAAASAYRWLDRAIFYAPVGMDDDAKIALTWWGCMSVEVNIGPVNAVFEPYMEPSMPRFHYIFVGHDHYDHCHEPTIRKLVTPNGPFEMLFASRSSFYASRMRGPTTYAFADSLPHDADLGFVPRDKAVAMYPKYRDTVGRHKTPRDRLVAYGGPSEMVVGRLRVEAFRSHEDTGPDERYASMAELRGYYPNIGYLVTDLETGFSVAHTSDIWNAYPEMERMRGKVDVLFYPLGKLPLEEKIKMMDYIRPRIAVPTHYRLEEEGFPIPATYLDAMTEDEVYDDLKAAVRGHWYPSPKDPAGEIRKQRASFEGLTRLVELRAGVKYYVPDERDRFEGRLRR